ncbi:hypothetical protein, partial [Amycolatopsis circi]|uniref:hypothetical protein n=1 Tax=Amycolatopsis circi TaxID=871959 RepID=UPI001ABF70D1
SPSLGCVRWGRVAVGLTGLKIGLVLAGRRENRGGGARSVARRSPRSGPRTMVGGRGVPSRT